MKEYNQFKRLRYDDNKTWKPHTTIDQLSDTTDISSSTISKLERGETDSCRVDTIKLYKKAFPNYSYEYFIEGIGAKEDKYAKIGVDFPYNDSFFRTLEILSTIKEDGIDNINLMNILFHDSEKVVSFLKVVFKSLREINELKSNRNLSKEFRIHEQKKIEFAMSSYISELLASDQILQLLQPAFDQYNDHLAIENSYETPIPFFDENGEPI